MVNIPHALSTLLGALILTTLSMIAPSARADIAIDTFGPADAYSAFTYRTFGGLSPTGRFAMRFVPAAAANIDRVSAAMSYGSTGSTTVTLSISAEVGGVPGATALWTSNTVTIGAVGIYVFTGPSIALTGGQAYWIAAYAPSSAALSPAAEEKSSFSPQ